MDTSTLAAALFVFSILAISLYVSWKHTQHIRTLYWIFLVLGTISVFVAMIWTKGIPEGLILGLICAPAWFFIVYLRFFWREKFARGLIDDLEAILPDLGATLSEDQDDLKKDA